MRSSGFEVLLSVLALVMMLTLRAGAAGRGVTYSWEFDKPGDTGGWVPANGFGPFMVEDGILKTSVVGFDPYMHSPAVKIDGQRDKLLQIRIKANKGSGMAVYWTTTTGGWSEERVFHFDIAADGNWHEYTVDLSVHPQWRQVTQFRLDLEPPNTEGAELEIDYIRILRVGVELSMEPFRVTKASLHPGEPFEVTSTLSNTGGETVKDCTVRLSLPGGLKVTGASERALGDLAPGEKVDLKWAFVADKVGDYRVGILVSSGSTKPLATSIALPVFLAPPPPSGDIPEDVRVWEDAGGNLVVENERMRVLFVKSPYGYAEIALYAAKEGKWERVASSSPISSIVILGRDGAPESLPVYPLRTEIIKAGGERGEIRLGCDVKDSSGTTWTFRFDFALDRGSARLETEYAASADGPAKLLRFSGPTLKVGEGSFGTKKDAALFPGLEWLVGDEASSSTLDAKPPYNLRSVPNPLKVTVPLMAVLNDGVLVSLMWDPRQRWDGKHDLVNAEFASPNWVEGQDNHLVGLFLPTTPLWVEENRSLATRPYELAAGDSLRIAAQIVVQSAHDVLAALDQWYAAYGVPEPEAAPRTWDEEKALLTHAYMRSYWIPQAKGWGHVYGWNPEPFPMAVALLDMLALRTSDKALVEEIAGRVREVMTHMVLTRDPGYVGSGAGAHIPLRLLPFYEGWVEQAVQGWEGEARALLASQWADGSWRFDPGTDPNRRQLGEVGAEAVGLTAVPAWTLLRIARFTGDSSFLEAGLRALEYMKKFQVPRAAQTWEVPVHTPDILAAGKAVAAYVEGYRLTGKKEYLDLARYWAKSGLPFLYSWGLPDRPMMKYGSIPVFGATFFTLPWFGRIVQWNGLVYAYHLLELAEFDGTFPWRKVAQGIVVSAMYQQRTSEPAKGGYPDVWELIPNRPIVNVDINPEGIAKPAFYLFEDRSPDAKTAIVQDGTRAIHVTSVAQIEEARMAGNVLSFRLGFFDGATSYCLVAGADEPRAVYVNGKELAAAGMWLQREACGWNYTRGYLIIKLRHEGETQVRVEF